MTSVHDLIDVRLRELGDLYRAVDSGRPADVRLTPRELEVSALAASGLPNKEIASRLYLSGNTIKTHLRNSYRKLNVRKRAQLRAALRGVGGVA